MIEILKKHQFLFEELIKRDFKRKYKGTILGMAWSVFNPLLMLLIMKIVFSHFFGGSIAHYTIYLFCGNIVFSYFSESTSEGMLALVGNAHIFTKVNVPKYLFLLAKNAQTLLNFSLTLIVFFLFCIFDGIPFTWKLVLLLYPIIFLSIFNLGCGFVLSALYVFFRDMRYLWTLMTQVLMYISAVFYSIDTFPLKAQAMFYLNPVYLFIRYFRSIVIDGAIPPVWFHILMASDALIVLGFGAWMYKKYNTEFLYYV